MPMQLPFAPETQLTFPPAETLDDPSGWHLPTQVDGVWSDGVAQCMATAIFQGADSRYYTRHVFPKMIRPIAGGAMVNITIGDIIKHLLTYQVLNGPVGAEEGLDLIAITLSILNKDETEKAADPAGDQADSDFEYQANCLVTDAERVYTEQIRIPGVETFDGVEAWFVANRDDIILRNGERAAHMVMVNLKKQRAPRVSA